MNCSFSLTIFLLASLVLTFASASQAAAVYESNFENPLYTLGPLAGQDGWFGSAVPGVETSLAFAGSQAVSWANSAPSATFSHSLTYDSTLDPLKTVVFDVEFQSTTSGTPSNWGVMAVVGNGGYIGQVFLSPTGRARMNVTSGNIGDVAVTAGTWNDFQLVLDFGSQTVSALVNGQFIASAGFSNPSTKLVAIVAGNGTAPGSDTGYWDQLSVASVAEFSVPEPGSAGLILSIALALIAARNRK
jgi:hypothetical protein